MQEVQETGVWPLGRGDPLEEGPTTHSSILAWETPWTEEPGGLQSMDGKELETTERLSAHTKSNFTCTNKIRAGGKNHGTRESCISEGSVSRPSQSPSSQVLQGYSWSCFHILKVHCDKQRHRRAGWWLRLPMSQGSCSSSNICLTEHVSVLARPQITIFLGFPFTCKPPIV